MAKPFEMWRDIPNTKGLYQASRNGEVRRVRADGSTRPVRTRIYMVRGGAAPRARVTLSIDGKRYDKLLMQCMVRAWLPALPDGMTYHHKNGDTLDNRLENLTPISRAALGRRSGLQSRSMSVEKIDRDGNVVALYRSVREAARDNYVSESYVRHRCYRQVKKQYSMIDYTFRFEEGKRYE